MGQADASVTLDLDAREFDARLVAIEQKLVKFPGKVSSAVAGGAGLGGSLSGLAGLIGGLGIGAAIKKTVDYGARVQDLSDRFGVSTDAIQQFGNAAEKNGSSLESMTMGFNKLAISRSKALGGHGDFAEAFERLGITLSDLKKLSPEQIMEKLGASALGAADTVKILGKNALELRNTLAGIADKTIDLGPIIDPKQIAALKHAQDTFKTLGEQGTVAGAAAVTGIADVVNATGAANKKAGTEAGKTVGTLLAKALYLKDALKDAFTLNFSGARANFMEIAGGVDKRIAQAAAPAGAAAAAAGAGKPGAKAKSKRTFDSESDVDDAMLLQFKEATKLTLAELAGRDAYGEGSIHRGKYIGGDILKAQAAQREKGLAEDAAFAGKDNEAKLHMGRFEQFTRGIDSIKSTEKSINVGQMVQSIEKSAQQIATNTAKQFVNH